MAYTDIDKSDDYFNTVLWTGNGTDGRTITGVGFQPDWVWVKDRSVARSHVVQDSVRGFNDGDKVLRTNGANSESSTDNDEFGYVGNTNSDGYTLEDGTTDGRYVNNNTETYVSWNWLAGGTASSNTDGSITSTVSANTTSGFSIVTYTGTGSADTVGHGLNSAPEMIILKRRDGGAGNTNWFVGHKDLTSWGYRVFLNSSVAEAADSDFLANTAPTSNHFSLSTDVSTNGSGGSQLAYCFHSVKGFSKFGGYTGNGSTDGTFIYTGFKPGFLMIKRTDDTNQWIMYDNKRNEINVVNTQLFANLNNSEASAGSGVGTDILSNGFKQRGTGNSYNASGGTYIYMAFAENPFVTSTGIPGLAR